ncbi:MAG: hypothetical protein H0U07_00480 [Actinobacteria bacterium]|nr:hypothetical protein [Actinomycetota bacterium]
MRPIVHRAAGNDLGVAAGFGDLEPEPELTLTADGAFASPFGPRPSAAGASTPTCW